MKTTFWAQNCFCWVIILLTGKTMTKHCSVMVGRPTICSQGQQTTLSLTCSTTPSMMMTRTSCQWEPILATTETIHSSLRLGAAISRLTYRSLTVVLKAIRICSLLMGGLVKTTGPHLPMVITTWVAQRSQRRHSPRQLARQVPIATSLAVYPSSPRSSPCAFMSRSPQPVLNSCKVFTCRKDSSVQHSIQHTKASSNKHSSRYSCAEMSAKWASKWLLQALRKLVWALSRKKDQSSARAHRIVRCSSRSRPNRLSFTSWDSTVVVIHS